MRTILFVFLVLALGCTNPATPKIGQHIVDPKPIVDSKPQWESNISSVSVIDGKIKIDTNIILTNQNLEPLVDELDNSNLTTRDSFEYIPRFIKYFLDRITSDSFSVANPGQSFQSTDIIMEKLQRRQLIYFGLGNNIAAMTYYTGGIGVSVHILILKFKGTKMVNFWSGNVLQDLKSKDEIIKYLKQNVGKHWGLNTNMICI